MRGYEVVTRTGLALAAAAMLAVPARSALAHEGHEHKALGKVAAMNEKQLRVETQEGQTMSFVLSSETTFKAGETEAQRADVKVGGRVVVVYEEKDGRNLAKEVLLPATGNKSAPQTH